MLNTSDMIQARMNLINQFDNLTINNSINEQTGGKTYTQDEVNNIVFNIANNFSYLLNYSVDQNNQLKRMMSQGRIKHYVILDDVIAKFDKIVEQADKKIIENEINITKTNLKSLDIKNMESEILKNTMKLKIMLQEYPKLKTAQSAAVPAPAQVPAQSAQTAITSAEQQPAKTSAAT